MKEERFPHARKPLRGRRLLVAEGGRSFGAAEERQQQGVEGKSERFPHGGSAPTSTHQPERLVCSPAGTGRGLGAEARASEVRSQGEDWGWLRAHSLKGLVCHSKPGGSPGKNLELPKRQETIVSECARRGDSEDCLNEL